VRCSRVSLCSLDDSVFRGDFCFFPPFPPLIVDYLSLFITPPLHCLVLIYLLERLLILGVSFCFVIARESAVFVFVSSFGSYESDDFLSLTFGVNSVMII
jgi:hypothetical protein